MDDSALDRLVSVAQTLDYRPPWQQEPSTVQLLLEHRNDSGLYALRTHHNYGSAVHDIFKVGRADSLSGRFSAYREAQTIVDFVPSKFPRTAELIALRVLTPCRVHARETVQCSQETVERVLRDAVAMVEQYVSTHQVSVPKTVNVEADRELVKEVYDWLETTPLRYTKSLPLKHASDATWEAFLTLVGINVTTPRQKQIHIPEEWINQIQREQREDQSNPDDSVRRDKLHDFAQLVTRCRGDPTSSLAMIQSVSRAHGYATKLKFVRKRKRNAEGHVVDRGKRVVCGCKFVL